MKGTLPEAIEHMFKDTKQDKSVQRLGESIYKRTKTRAKNGAVYAFGRDRAMEGKPGSLGGYILFKFKESYNGSLPGGIERRWVVDKGDMTYQEAVALMNKRCGFRAFEP